MLQNSELTVPVNNDKARTILARRGDELRWFTPLGFKAMPAQYNKDAQGKTKQVLNDGWVQVDPSAFSQPPAPITAAQVVSPQTEEGKKTTAADVVPPVKASEPKADPVTNEASAETVASGPGTKVKETAPGNVQGPKE